MNVPMFQLLPISRSVWPLNGEGCLRGRVHCPHWRKEDSRCAGQRPGAQQEVGHCHCEKVVWMYISEIMPQDDTQRSLLRRQWLWRRGRSSYRDPSLLLCGQAEVWIKSVKMQGNFVYEISFREENKIDLPEQGKYGTGIIFMDKDSEESSRLIKFWSRVCFSSCQLPGQSFLSWPSPWDSLSWPGESRHVITRVWVRITCPWKS